ncbi:conserved hypothetical protein [Mesorhizobium prunaredense]|uniref:Uncharacterized protein n=1 Tax=Mesorhizobium prunaredense TaxID=1631249 RepID=A0A1R3V7H9_9HYPH|nr:conserved hypothetical protein [Mesorhizobium prunaredense]
METPSGAIRTGSQGMVQELGGATPLVNCAGAIAASGPQRRRQHAEEQGRMADCPNRLDVAMLDELRELGSANA